MPQIRKLLKVGTSRGITLPATWLSEIEERQGKIAELLIEVDGSILVRPREKKNLKDA